MRATLKSLAASIYSAAVLGDEAAVRALLARDSALATGQAARTNGMLSPISASRAIFASDKTRSDAFVSCARALLEGRRQANTGWTETIDEIHRASFSNP